MMQKKKKAARVPLRGEITLLFWVCPQADCGGGQIVVLRVVCVCVGGGGGEEGGGGGGGGGLLNVASREQ